MRTYGVKAFREEIERAMELAARAEAWIRSEDNLELLSPAQLGIVCFRNIAGQGVGPTGEQVAEARNRGLVEELTRSGAGMVSSTRVRGRYAMRLCIMNHRTRWDDVESVLRALSRAM